MSHYLRRFARTAGMKKDHARSIRLPKEVAEEFERHCRRYGLSFNEGILHLILHELGKDRETTTQHGVTIEIQKPHRVIEDEPKRITSVSQPKPHINTNASSSRYSVKPYEVDGYVPCPICRKWYSYTNYARHCNTAHGKGSQEVIESNKEVVEQMVRTRKGATD